jgi:hypothetical protein
LPRETASIVPHSDDTWLRGGQKVPILHVNAAYVAEHGLLCTY